MANPGEVRAAGSAGDEQGHLAVHGAKQLVTTMMVFIFVRISLCFFFLVDLGVVSLVSKPFLGGCSRLMDYALVRCSRLLGISRARSLSPIKEQAVSKRVMEELFEEVLVPMEEVVQMRRGAKVNAERKFFPGYVLAKMEMTDDAWHLVKDTPKVTGFLGADNKPSPISGRSAAYPASGSGRRRAAQAVCYLRDR
jgi:hypothetical protein